MHPCHPGPTPHQFCRLPGTIAAASRRGTTPRPPVGYVYHEWGPLEDLIYCGASDPACAAANGDRVITHDYDLAGNLESVHDSALPPQQESDTYRLTSDGQGRVAEVRVNYLPVAGTRVLSYDDAHGNRELASLDDAGAPLSIEYGYDGANRLDQIEEPGTPAHTIGLAWGPDDALRELQWSGGAKDAFRHTARGFLESVVWPGNLGLYSGADPNSPAAGYTYRPDGSVTQIVEQYAGAAHTWSYGYDALNRLDQVTYPSPGPAGWSAPAETAYDYDAAGNRESTGGGTPPAFPYAHDAYDRMSESPQWSSIAYDADGNTLTRTDRTTSSVQGFTWDRLSRLASFDPDTSVSSDETTYVYDVFGRRVKKSAPSTATWYVWDGDALLAEYTGSPLSLDRWYVYGTGFAPVEMRVQDASPSGESTYRVHVDHLDTPRLLTDEAGAPVWHAAYEAFGRAHLDPSPSGGSVDFHFRFPGQYFDAESGLHYNRFRYYDPSVGRYVSAHPIGTDGGTNLFAYSRDRPTASIDPLGLRPGDRYEDLDLAGTAAANDSRCASEEAEPRAREAGLPRAPEYGTAIRENEDGTYSYGVPETSGHPGTVNIGAPEGTVAVAHSHTDDHVGPSGRDMREADDRGIDSYIGNKDGSVSKYTPNEGTITIQESGGSDQCMCYSPGN